MARVSPTDGQMDTLIEAYEVLRAIVNKEKPDLDLLMYGSVVNGLITMDSKSPSDLDLTVVSAHAPDLQDRNLVNEVKKILNKRKPDNKLWTIANMKAPIQATFGRLLDFEIKFAGDSKRPAMTIDVEITEGKILEVCNSNLLQSYCKLDSRFRKLAIVLKAWNKTLSVEKNSRFNSFTICLLLLGYMLHNEYLPCLQQPGERMVRWVSTSSKNKSAYKLTMHNANIFFLNFEDDFEQIESLMTDKMEQNQKKPASMVLKDFFDFYASKFNPEDHLLDVTRQRALQPLFEKVNCFEIDPVFTGFEEQTYKIRDPFNNTYNPAKVYKGKKNTEFINACKEAGGNVAAVIANL